MASQAQIDANRRNAQLSTGPKTPEGKATVSRNALKHGRRSEVYNEVAHEPEIYTQLLADLIAEHQPQTPTEETYVERMALCLDKLTCLEGMQNECLYGLHPNRDFNFSEEKQLTIYWNQQERLERAFDRALTMLRKLQKERRQCEAAPTASAKQDPEPTAAARTIQSASAHTPPPSRLAATPDRHSKPVTPIPDELAS